MTKIQNGHHFDIQLPKWQILLLYSACNAYWSTLVSFNTRKTWKTKKGNISKKFKMAAILMDLHQMDAIHWRPHMINFQQTVITYYACANYAKLLIIIVGYNLHLWFSRLFACHSCMIILPITPCAVKWNAFVSTGFPVVWKPRSKGYTTLISNQFGHSFVATRICSCCTLGWDIFPPKYYVSPNEKHQDKLICTH